jgi:hypothetical protein
MSQTTSDSKVADLKAELAAAKGELDRTKFELSEAQQSGSSASLIESYEANVISIQMYTTKLTDQLSSLIGGTMVSTGKL